MAKHFLEETGRKVKKGIEEMKPDMLTKYLEPAILQKHCAALNLRFALQSTIVASIVRKGSSTEVILRIDENVSPGSWNGWTVVACCLVLAVGFALGWCARGLRAKSTTAAGDETSTDGLEEDEITVPGSPAPEVVHFESTVAGSPAPWVAVSPAPREQNTTASSSTHSAAVCELFNKFNCSELKQLCKLHGLHVSGLKGDLIRRIAACSTTPSVGQAQAVLEYFVVSRRQGRRPTVYTVDDASCRDKTSAWLRRVGFGAESEHFTRRSGWTGTPD